MNNNLVPDYYIILALGFGFFLQWAFNYLENIIHHALDVLELKYKKNDTRSNLPQH